MVVMPAMVAIRRALLAFAVLIVTTIPPAVAAPGNGNGGHAYGTQLTAEQRRQLIEYLKTL